MERNRLLTEFFVQNWFHTAEYAGTHWNDLQTPLSLLLSFSIQPVTLTLIFKIQDTRSCQPKRPLKLYPDQRPTSGFDFYQFLILFSCESPPSLCESIKLNKVKYFKKTWRSLWKHLSSKQSLFTAHSVPHPASESTCRIVLNSGNVHILLLTSGQNKQDHQIILYATAKPQSYWQTALLPDWTRLKEVFMFYMLYAVCSWWYVLQSYINFVVKRKY